jgi:hypothetical protein
MISDKCCVPLTLLLTAGLLHADEPKMQAQSEYRRPELVAIAWQDSTKPGSDRPYNSVWREDGTLIEGDELEWLRNELMTFNTTTGIQTASCDRWWWSSASMRERRHRRL